MADNQNIDGIQLERAFNNAAAISDMQGMAVARNNVIVAEEYYSYAGENPDTDLDVRSVTKSFTSTLIGIAIDKGHLQSVDQKLIEFLEDEVEIVNPALGQVTIKQLLTMSCGHEWAGIDEPSEVSAFVSAPDQLNYIMNKPIVNTPGTVFDYSDGAAHLASVVLTKATKMSASAYADKYLFGPMGRGNRKWKEDNRGFNYGGIGLHVGIHDMIYIGYLYLDDGMFDGKRIVSEAWINEATTTKISTGPLISYLTDYGYYWWIGSRHGHDYILALGYGGQFILVVKELNLVVAARCNYSGRTTTEAGQNWYAIHEIIINQILPAVRD